jgi:hypothetical protein
MATDRVKPSRKALGAVGIARFAPAPVFSITLGGPSLATIYGGHYNRLMAIYDAAKSGNSLLLKLAIEHQDAHGSGE